jgi:predicted phage terminase large subunit-like protein
VPTPGAAAKALRAERLLVTEARLNRLAEDSLFAFLCAAWPLLEPGRRFVPGAHIGAIARALEAVADGRLCRLIISISPRSAKSTLVSVAFPAWLWARRPQARILSGSHSASLAVRDAVRMRRLIESPWYQRAWGDRFRMAGDQNAKLRMETDATGHRIAFGVTSGITGEGGDIILLDDPNTADDMFSEAGRRAVTEAWDQQISTRLNDPERSAVVLVQQRVHEGDLTGHLLAKGGWRHLRIPFLYEAAFPCEVPEIGFRDWRTEEGQPFWPERFPPGHYEEQLRNLGSFGTAAQLQQRPAPAEGGMVNLRWFRRYRALPSRDRWVEVVVSVDSATKGVELVNAPWVIGTWIRTDTGGAYLVKVTRRWMNYPEGKRALLSEYDWCCANLAPPHAVLVEDKATGSSLLQELGDQTGMPLLAVEPDRDKVTRLGVESPFIEAGNMWLPEHAEWLSAYEQEMGAFPHSSTMDQADMTSQTLRHFREGGASAGPRLRSL